MYDDIYAYISLSLIIDTEAGFPQVVVGLVALQHVTNMKRYHSCHHSFHLNP